MDWKRLAHQFFRTAGAAIAAFIVLNALGDILLPRFGADFLWIVFPEWLRIPGRIVLLGAAASLGWAAARPLLRKRVFVAAQALLLIVAFAAFVNVIAFYFLLLGGRVASRFPVPSSLLVVAVMVMNVRRIRIEHALGRRIDADETPLRLGVVHGASLAGVSVLAPLVLVLAYGTTDYSHMAGGERAPAVRQAHDRRVLSLSKGAPADCIVVYGAKVHEDGSLSLALADRVRHGVHLFNDGRGRRLVMSGGTNADGTSEPRSMKRFAVDLGVPADAIILDEAGLDTYRSAVGVRKLMDERGWRLSISVSHYYHLLRIQMAARRAGLATLTVPCRMSRRLAKEPWFLAREIAAFYFYYFLRWGEPADVEPPEEGPVPLQLP